MRNGESLVLGYWEVGISKIFGYKGKDNMEIVWDKSLDDWYWLVWWERYFYFSVEFTKINSFNKVQSFWLGLK